MAKYFLLKDFIRITKIYPLSVIIVLLLTLLSLLQNNNVDIVIEEYVYIFLISLFCLLTSYNTLAIRKFITSSVDIIIKALLVVITLILAKQIGHSISILFFLSSLAILFIISSILLKKYDEAQDCKVIVIIILNILFSLIIAFIFAVGLSFAFWGVEFLFDITLNNIFSNIWIVSFSLIWPMIILHKINLKEQQSDYPYLIEVALLYIFPLLTLIYFCILYAYIIKIALVFEIPKGKMVLIAMPYCLMGIFTQSFLYPLRNKSIFFVRIIFKYFYPLLLVPIITLYISIFIRIEKYGITELRYFTLLLCLWFTACMLYCIFRKHIKIKFILLLLSIMLFFSSFGFWGAQAISVDSQSKILKQVLTKENLLQHGKIRNQQHYLDKVIYNKIDSIISYLLERDKLKFVNSLFEDTNLSKINDKKILYQNIMKQHFTIKSR